MEFTETVEGSRAGGRSARRAGSVTNAITKAASAWNSLCDAEGRERGATGADGGLGLTQHAGVEQCLLSQPAQQQLVFEFCVVTPIGAKVVNTPWHVRTKPTRRTIAILAGRNVIVLQLAVLILKSWPNLPHSARLCKSFARAFGFDCQMTTCLGGGQ
jgi:hypothetical protein